MVNVFVPAGSGAGVVQNALVISLRGGSLQLNQRLSTAGVFKV